MPPRSSRRRLGGTGDELVERALGEHHGVVDEHVVGVQLADVEQVHRREVAEALARRPRRRAQHDRARACARSSSSDSATADLVFGVAPSTRASTTSRGRRAPGRRGRRAGRRPSSSSGCAASSRAAPGRGRRHRRRTAARGSSPDGPGRCPSGGTASCHRRTPRRGSWSCACPDGPPPAAPPRPGGSAGCWSGRRRSPPGRSTVDNLRHAQARPLGRGLDQDEPAVRAGDGTLDRIRPFSASTAWTVRFWTVTRAEPIRPAMRTPLKTRPGVAQAPMEPGERCLRWTPWPGAQALEVVALHDTGEALALGGAGDVDDLTPASNVSAVISWPSEYSAASVVRISTR